MGWCSATCCDHRGAHPHAWLLDDVHREAGRLLDLLDLLDELLGFGRKWHAASASWGTVARLATCELRRKHRWDSLVIRSGWKVAWCP